MNVVAVVLAAGASRRLGRAKQEVPFEGRALLTRAVDAALGSRCQEVIVVLGCEADRLARLVPAGADVLRNDGWKEGIASSIRLAVEHIRGRSEPPAAIVLAVCDQPALDEDVLDRLIATWERANCWAVAARYEGNPGVPALFDRRAFSELVELRGDRGARDLLRRDPARVVAVDWPEGARDLDRPKDLDSGLSG